MVHWNLPVPLVDDRSAQRGELLRKWLLTWKYSDIVLSL